MTPFVVTTDCVSLNAVKQGGDVEFGILGEGNEPRCLEDRSHRNTEIISKLFQCFIHCIIHWPC